jgi:4,5-DOPA dioxygenase extradiol
MDRRRALQIFGGTVALAGGAGILHPMMQMLLRRLTVMNGSSALQKDSQTMPVLFIGHGSPMNAVQVNSFTKSLNELGQKLAVPRAIVVVSAHWMTQGTYVTHMAQPKTIHDFYGFPQELFNIQYPAPGSPETADLIARQITSPEIKKDDSEWGLDHGTWSVLRHIYPDAKIPIVQVSLDMTKPASFHLALGEKLRNLREQGVLVVGSGNIVHNLRQLDWDENAKAFPWAEEFDNWVKERILKRDFKSLSENYAFSKAGQLSHPSPDHYFPLMYALGASTDKDELRFIYEGIQHGSISMRCLQFG